MISAIEARKALASKSRHVGSKLMTAREAVGLVKDGDHLALGGCLFSRTPIALVHELIRAGRRHLTVSRSLLGYEGELLMAAGTVDRIVTSWQGLGLRWGLSKVLRHYVESGQITFEEWSHLSLGLRYRAGAMGVPFLPTLSMLGSNLAGPETSKMVCPFTGQTVNLVPALFPDVAFLHVHQADRRGNARIEGYVHMDPDIARAARLVILSAEEIVDELTTREHPDLTVIPAMAVDAVIHVPFGAFPGECFGRYESDFEYFDRYVKQIVTEGVVDGISGHMDTHVRDVPDHAALLEQIGGTRLDACRRAAIDLVYRAPA